MLAVIALESADEAGGLEFATAVVVTGLPTWVPFGAGQAPPLVWAGSGIRGARLVAEQVAGCRGCSRFAG
jgi:hypothetical protein